MVPPTLSPSNEVRSHANAALCCLDQVEAVANANAIANANANDNAANDAATNENAAVAVKGDYLPPTGMLHPWLEAETTRSNKEARVETIWKAEKAELVGTLRRTVRQQPSLSANVFGSPLPSLSPSKAVSFSPTSSATIAAQGLSRGLLSSEALPFLPSLSSAAAKPFAPLTAASKPLQSNNNASIFSAVDSSNIPAPLSALVRPFRPKNTVADQNSARINQRQKPLFPSTGGARQEPFQPSKAAASYSTLWLVFIRTLLTHIV